MYLSRLILNPRNPAVRRDMAGHQDLHRTVLSLFPPLPPDAAGQDARQHFGVLHRLEKDLRTGVPALLVQSRAAPDFSRLPAGYALALPDQQRNPDCKEVGASFHAIRAGMHLAFRLRANPTRKIDTKSGPDGRRRNGKRVDLRSEEEWWAWLARKGQDAGFRLLTMRARHPVEAKVSLGPPPPDSQPASPDVPDVRVSPTSRLWGRPAPPGPGRRGGVRDSRGNRLTFASVLFEGRLEVVDAACFRTALETGVGPAKAYGFGLLSVAPLTADGAAAPAG